MNAAGLLSLAPAGWLVFASASAGAQIGTTPSAPASAAPAPPAPADRGRFAAIWVTPIATHQFQGAGGEAGYRYKWLVGPIFIANVTAYVGSDPEARFSLGVCWGRYARR